MHHTYQTNDKNSKTIVKNHMLYKQMQKAYKQCQNNLQTIIKNVQQMQHTYQTNDKNIKQCLKNNLL